MYQLVHDPASMFRVTDARTSLLERLIEEVAAHGLADRSLRDVAEGAGTSHRMVLYHFGTRAGLVRAIVTVIEARQREMMAAAALEASDRADLIRRVWRSVSADAMRPFVRLFFECVATAGDELTDTWIEAARDASPLVEAPFDPDDIRLGIAVTRGLLIDVLTTGETGPATRAIERFIDMLES